MSTPLAVGVGVGVLELQGTCSACGIIVTGS
jgi:hypothetical protein